MARGVQIPITLNPREFIRGLRQVEVGLEDVTDEFRTLETRADRAADGVERSLEGAADDVERAFSGLGRRFDAEMDRVERRARDAGDDVARGLGSGRGRVGSVGAEVADEFTENFGEAMRSGNPSDAVLETFTSLGPALGALGLGAALVVGIVKGIREEAARIRTALIESVTGPADETLEQQGYVSGQQFIAGLNKALGEEGSRRAALQDYFGADSFVEALTAAQGLAADLGVGMLQVEDIVGGTTWQTEATVAALEQQAAILQGQISAAYAEAEGSMDNMTLAQQEQVAAWTAQRDGIRDLIEAGQTRLGQVETEAGAVNEIYLETVLVTEAARDAAAAARGGATAAWDAAAGWAATRDRILEGRDALARAREEANGIPRSVTVNVVNKLATVPIP